MSTWFATYGFAEVYPDLLVGAYPLDEADVETLRRLSVGRVLNLVEDSEYRPGHRELLQALFATHRIDETRLRLVDFGHLPAEQIEEAVSTLVDWIDHGQRIYVHCRAGWQRSAAVAAGAVAVVEGIDILDALRYVRERKPSADPLPHQRDDLLEWWERRAPRRSQ